MWRFYFGIIDLELYCDKLLWDFLSFTHGYLCYVVSVFMYEPNFIEIVALGAP